MPFKVYGKRRGQFQALGGDKYVHTYETEAEAVETAKSVVGMYDALEVRNEDDAVVWELTDARSAPKSEVTDGNFSDRG